MLREKLIVNNVMQMAHDIRSPLFALQTILEAPGEFDEKKKNLLMKAAQRLQEIADGILSENKKANLSLLIEEVVTEKQICFPHLNTTFKKSKDIFQNLNATEMKRVISNLINNAIEACDEKTAEIQISLENSNGKTQITIQDNGKGIPQALLPRIVGRSFGKNGNGLGLSHAKNYMDSIGGNLQITSEVHQGTRVVLVFNS